MPTIRDLLQEESEEIVRQHLRKIVEIYDVEWIVVHELVQNAIDAIQANQRVTHGEVDVVLDFDESSVFVKDNGTGFQHDLNLLRPGATGKEKRLSSRSPAKGYQGVGLKAVMYSTSRFELESQTPDESWTFLCEGLNEYVDPDETSTPEYIEESNLEPSQNTYTRVKAKFPEGKLEQFVGCLNRFMNEDSVKWKGLFKQEEDEKGHIPYSEYLSHFFSWYFRTHSYVGCANSLLNVAVQNPDTGEMEDMKPTAIKLHLKSSEGFDGLEGRIGNWLSNLDGTEFSTTFPYEAWDYAEVISSNHERAAKYRTAPKLVQTKPNDDDWSRLSATFRDDFLDLKLTPNENADNFGERYADIISIMERPHSSVDARDYEDVLEKVTGIYLAIGRTSWFETLGITNRGLKMIASNGTPTAHELTVRSTSSTWYLETMHIIINVDATLNIGKRHLVNTRLVGRIRDFFEACYPKLVSISKAFVERDTTGPSDDPLPEVTGLQSLNREGLPFRKFPDDESTLVGLFSTAISRLSPNFSVYGYFGNARYDGKFLWLRQEPSSDAELRKLEFKLKLNKLVEEFDLATHDKEFSEIALVVVWDRRTDKQGWTVKGISDAKRTSLEGNGVPTDLVEYVLEDKYGNFVPLVCVADLIQRIPLLDDTEDDLNDFVDEMN